MFESLVMFSTGIIGFLAVIIIFYGYKSNKITNSYLILLFSIMSIRFFLTGLYSILDTEYLNSLINNYNNILIFTIPISYLYFKNLIIEKKNQVWDLLHLMVPIFYLIIDFLDDNHHIAIPFKNNFFYISFFTYVFTYIITSYTQLSKYVWNKESKIEIVNKQNSLIKNWTKFLFSTLVIMAIRLLLSLFIEITNNSFDNGQTFIWISAIIWLCVFLRILLFPDVLFGYSFLLKKFEEQNNSSLLINPFWKKESEVLINNTQDQKLKVKIDGSINTYKKNIDLLTTESYCFRNSKFSLGDLATKLNIPKSHLVYLFKYHSEISFSDFKKIIRIKDGLNLIESDYLKMNTFDSLAKQVGFASYNTFFTSFKDVTGVTPLEYKSSLIKK